MFQRYQILNVFKIKSKRHITQGNIFITLENILNALRYLLDIEKKYFVL